MTVPMAALEIFDTIHWSESHSRTGVGGFLMKNEGTDKYALTVIGAPGYKKITSSSNGTRFGDVTNNANSLGALIQLPDCQDISNLSVINSISPASPELGEFAFLRWKKQSFPLRVSGVSVCADVHSVRYRNLIFLKSEDPVANVLAGAPITTEDKQLVGLMLAIAYGGIYAIGVSEFHSQYLIVPDDESSRKYVRISNEAMSTFRKRVNGEIAEKAHEHA